MSIILELDDVTKLYPRGVEEVRAIDGLSLAIEHGELLTVVGRSGAGKTTLLNLVGCVDRPTSGTITLSGMEVAKLNERALSTIRSTTMGFVFQQFFLIPTLSALENVMLPGRFCARRSRELGAKAGELLARVGLADRAEHLPSELSGGEMQRVAIARALVNEPEILLADEPTGNLDSRNAEEISAIFRELNDRGLTIVVVTHNPTLAELSTRTVHLEDGKIVDVTELRSVPTPDREVVRLAEPVAVPEYMPASREKREWGSPAVAASVFAGGTAMLASAFMPLMGTTTGYSLVGLNRFTINLYRGNALVRIYAGRHALLFTGLWPILLGLLLMASGVVFLFRQRLAGLAVAGIGSVGAAIAFANLVMIYTQFNSQLQQGPTNTNAGLGLWVFLGVSVAGLALGAGLLMKYRRA